MIDNIIYKLEEVNEDIEEAVRLDREYFLERKEELIEELNQLIKRIEDE